MSLSVGSSTHAAVPPPAVHAGSANSASASHVQQQQALNQLVSRYRTGVQSGQSAASLQALARQIATQSHALGQTINLPKIPTPSAAAPTVNGKLSTVA